LGNLAGMETETNLKTAAMTVVGIVLQ